MVSLDHNHYFKSADVPQLQRNKFKRNSARQLNIVLLYPFTQTFQLYRYISPHGVNSAICIMLRICSNWGVIMRNNTIIWKKNIWLKLNRYQKLKNIFHSNFRFMCCMIHLWNNNSGNTKMAPNIPIVIQRIVFYECKIKKFVNNQRVRNMPSGTNMY